MPFCLTRSDFNIFPKVKTSTDQQRVKQKARDTCLFNWGIWELQLPLKFTQPTWRRKKVSLKWEMVKWNSCSKLLPKKGTQSLSLATGMTPQILLPYNAVSIRQVFYVPIIQKICQNSLLTSSEKRQAWKLAPSTICSTSPRVQEN